MKMTMKPKSFPSTGDVTQIEGLWVYGGMLYDHFGHFLTESMSRLWIFDHIPNDISNIIYIPKDKKAASEQSIEKSSEILSKFLGRKIKVKSPTTPTSVSSLIVPQQGFGLGNLAHGTTEFIDFSRNFFSDLSPNGHSKIYISRRKLPPKYGRFFGECFIEEFLEKNGFTVFHPQEHSLEDQVKQYKAAEEIVSSDCSALHLASFFLRPEASVAIIKRRFGNQYKHFVKQIESFSGKDPTIISALKEEVLGVKGTKRASSHTYTNLDFDSVFSSLNKFISKANISRLQHSNQYMKEIIETEIHFISRRISPEKWGVLD